MSSELHTAVRNGDRTSVQKLLNLGADVNAFYYGTTPLLVAIMKDNEDLAVMLLTAGCDIALMDVQKTSLPFFEAVLRNQVKVVETMVGKGVTGFDARLLKSHHTPLTFAAEKGFSAMVQVLLKAGASASLENGKQESALYLASREGHDAICQSLLSAGATKDSLSGENGQSPLIAAVINEHVAAAKVFIKAGCDVNLADKNGNSALWYAVSSYDLGLSKLLVKAGANINCTDSDGMSLLQMVKQDEMDDMLEVLTAG